MGLRAAANLPLLLAADRGLARRAGGVPVAPSDRDLLARRARILAGLPRAAFRRLKRRLGRG
jgi:hypothetical protein